MKEGVSTDLGNGIFLTVENVVLDDPSTRRYRVLIYANNKDKQGKYLIVRQYAIFVDALHLKKFSFEDSKTGAIQLALNTVITGYKNNGNNLPVNNTFWYEHGRYELQDRPDYRI